MALQQQQQPLIMSDVDRLGQNNATAISYDSWGYPIRTTYVISIINVTFLSFMFLWTIFSMAMKFGRRANKANKRRERATRPHYYSLPASSSSEAEMGYNDAYDGSVKVIPQRIVPAPMRASQPVVPFDPSAACCSMPELRHSLPHLFSPGGCTLFLGQAEGSAAADCVILYACLSRAAVNGSTHWSCRKKLDDIMTRWLRTEDPSRVPYIQSLFGQLYDQEINNSLSTERKTTITETLFAMYASKVPFSEPQNARV